MQYIAVYDYQYVDSSNVNPKSQNWYVKSVTFYVTSTYSALAAVSCMMPYFIFPLGADIVLLQLIALPT